MNTTLNGNWARSILTNTTQGYNPKSCEEFIGNISLLMPLLDTLTNIVFFVKDDQARYQLANETLVKRSNLKSQQEILGLTTEQVFPQQRGKEYLVQDLRVLKEGQAIDNRLELHNYISGQLGWCITHKFPIYNIKRHIVAMVGVSIDIDEDNDRVLRKHAQLAIVEQFIKNNIDQKISILHLARLAKLSQSQLERTFKIILNMSPIQFVQKIRLEFAIKLLSNPNFSITDISLNCGYTDHSAFSRQFKQLTGFSPTEFRKSYFK